MARPTWIDQIAPSKVQIAGFLGLCCAWITCAEAPAQKAPVGHIVGHIDGISQDGDHYFLLGWACQQGQSKSINIQLFAPKTTDGISKDGPLFAETADLFSEPGVATVCHDPEDGKHRFIFVLPYGYGPQSKLSVHGIRIVDGVPNDLVAGSGRELPPRPLNASYPTLPDLAGDYQSLTHPGVFMTAGEIADRFRNAKAGQGIGYPMFTLERLFDAAELIQNAGIDPYGYRGLRGQSIEMAVEYYACFARGAGFNKTVTRENSGSCPDATQYYGGLVNGVDRMLLIGAERFPRNKAITGLEAAAKQQAATPGAFTNDAILFGKWRD